MVALGSADEGVCLTRRAADNHVYLPDSAYLHYSVDGLENGGERFVRQRLVDDCLCHGGGNHLHELIAADISREVFPV